MKQSPEYKKRFKQGIRDEMSLVVEHTRDGFLKEGTQNVIRHHFGLDPSKYSSLKAISRPGPHGLYQINRKQVAARSVENFLAFDGSDVSDSIACSRSGAVPTPNCGLRLEYNQFNIRANFPLQEIGDWQTHRKGIERLMDCFVIERAPSPRSAFQ